MIGEQSAPRISAWKRAQPQESLISSPRNPGVPGRVATWASELVSCATASTSAQRSSDRCPALPHHSIATSVKPARWPMCISRVSPVGARHQSARLFAMTLKTANEPSLPRRALSRSRSIAMSMVVSTTKPRHPDIATGRPWPPEDEKS